MKRFFRNLCGKRAKQTLPTVAETIGTQQQVGPVVEEPTIPLQVVPEVEAVEAVVPQVQETVPQAEEAVPKVVAAAPNVGATIPAASTALGPKETVREVKIKAPKTPVFRVTRIPPEVTVDDLKTAFLKAFPEAGAEIDTSRVTICSSCYGDGTNTAFIQFTPKTPDELDRLGNCETRQVPIGNPPRNVAVDKDFYGLTQLYSPEGRHIRADIVAICRLNGHAYGSWTGRGNLPNMWLRDFFPEDFPKCRTMIYGYNTDLRSHVNHTTLDYAKALLEELTKARRSEQERNRPIVFIAHGFGGIVLAQAIVRASEEASLHYPLAQSTRGIIFFGTPHRGFTVDDILAMLEPGSPREPLVKVIGEGTALQADLDKFIKCCENFKIVSFEEKHQTQRVKKNEDGTCSRGGDYTTAVGPESSALLLPPTIEEILPAEGDHSNMVKFAHTGNTSYTSVVRNMRKFTLHDGKNHSDPL